MSGEDPASSLQHQTQAFLREFFEKGEELVRELIEENERLKATLATRSAVDQDGANVDEILARLTRQIERLEAECIEIRRLAGTVDRGTPYRERLDSLEREHYNLAAMYVAGSQFHTATTIDEVLRTLTEVLLNFVGVGRFTVYCVDEERQVLFPLRREGANLADCDEFALPTSGPIYEALADSGPWRTGRPRGQMSGALMHLPLCSGTRLIGLARIESFLPQKAAFADNDDSLLELISEASGVGIETAWIRAHASDAPLSRQPLEELVAS